MYLPQWQKYLLWLSRGGGDWSFSGASPSSILRNCRWLKGDAVFFNLAPFDVAGTNRTTDVHRMANLLQISSAFGRAMEAMDRERDGATRSTRRSLAATGSRARRPPAVANVVAACAEGYAFPTEPRPGPARRRAVPPSQADVVSTALTAGWPPEQLRVELAAHAGTPSVTGPARTRPSPWSSEVPSDGQTRCGKRPTGC